MKDISYGSIVEKPSVNPFIWKQIGEAKANQRTILVREYVKTMVNRANRRKKTESTTTQRQWCLDRNRCDHISTKKKKKKSQKRAEVWGHGFLTRNIQFGSIAYYVLKEMAF